MTGRIRVESVAGFTGIRREVPILATAIIGAAIAYASAPDIANAPESSSTATYQSHGARNIVLGTAGGLGGKAAGSAAGAYKLSQGTAKKVELTNSQLKSIRSLEKQIVKHQKKLDDFKANPTVRPGMEKLPKNVIKRQQNTRIKHLETEINTFKNNIKKIKKGNL